jgi:hypothetical protein
MNHVGLVDDRVSEVFAEILWSAEVNLSTSEKSGQLSFEPDKSEKTYCRPRLELDEHINIALWPEIRAHNGTKE